MLSKQSGRGLNLGWGLLKTSWREKAGRLAVSRVGEDVQQGEQCAPSPRGRRR